MLRRLSPASQMGRTGKDEVSKGRTRNGTGRVFRADANAQQCAIDRQGCEHAWQAAMRPFGSRAEGSSNDDNDCSRHHPC
jgi:hypothetical protein